jgi:hypothetical protein
MLCSTLPHLFKCPVARIFYKEGSGLEPKLADFHSKEPILIPNCSNFPLCSKHNDAKNRPIGTPSDFYGRSALSSSFFIVFAPNLGELNNFPASSGLPALVHRMKWHE